MSNTDVATKEWLLPVSVTSRVDLGRLLRELDKIDEFLNQAAIREPGSAVNIPKTSRIMDEVAQENELNLLRSEDRQSLKDFLLAVKAKATIMHISFSADPTPSFTNKLVGWLRREIHPFLLIDIGLQPTIGAGCIVRTDNKIFDFSLRQRLVASREILMQKLHDGLSKPDQESEEAQSQGNQTSTEENQPVPENIQTESQPEQSPATEAPAENQTSESSETASAQPEASAASQPSAVEGQTVQSGSSVDNQSEQPAATEVPAEPQSAEPAQPEAASGQQPERPAPQVAESAEEQTGNQDQPAAETNKPQEQTLPQPQAQPEAAAEQTEEPAEANK